MDENRRRAIALWKVSVLGPLISARLAYGDRRALFDAAADRIHQMPDGRYLKLSARTVEDWFYAFERGGFDALVPKTRKDAARSRAIKPEVADVIVRAKRERPRRSIRRIIRILERAKVVRVGELSRSSVHRLLARHGISARPKRGPAAERRSFMVERAGDLWFGDAMHGPPVIAPDGTTKKSYMLSQLDGATRFVTHSVFLLSESAVAHESGFKQALLKYGRPRVYYIDRGAAYKAISLRDICRELGIRPVTTLPQDCEAKGAIERWHRTWREEVGDELPDYPLPLADLNAKHWAWLAVEYHQRRHETTRRAPRDHWLDQVDDLRALPAGKNLDDVFLHRERRKVRKDGTVRFRGQLLEVRPELTHQTVELRFDPTDNDARPRVFIDGRFVCDTVLLDRFKNATRGRRRNLGTPDPTVEPTGLDPLGLLEDEYYHRKRRPPRKPEKHADSGKPPQGDA